jgi:hypothetical protein
VESTIDLQLPNGRTGSAAASRIRQRPDLTRIFAPACHESRAGALSKACFSAASRRLQMSVLIGILITFLVVVLILWLVQRLPVDARVKQIIQIVVIIIGIVSLLKYLAVF